jgi:hypothetical protein
MLSYRTLGCHDLVRTEVINQLAHIESELCWCDPIVEVDENGNDMVIHREVIWN